MYNIYKSTNTIKEVIRIEFRENISEKELDHFQKSVIKIMNTEYSKLSFLQLDKEDFVSHIFFALKEVKEKYDINKNVPLIAYANFIIKRRILDYAKYLKRDKRKITLKLINSYRSSLTEDGQTYLERDIEKFSLEKSEELERNKNIKEMINHFIENDAQGKEAEIIKMLYKGYNQREILEKLNIKRKEFLVCKEKLKNLFKGFIKVSTNI
ncbi:hypothetical protein [Spiroplasma diminutum]|uniref:Uncharacterized protein n=1 Tax=Spiroplasma diminutum CUAS-1 TaxID=1276221 RepID=S5LYW4_9MOLU|nr:hypothetical protein [Spiroplasma diminutum]AGR41736.1 hypothetical protein SDIMI_v3c00320 [Spiroplasma diminutum CUAS-1]